MHYPLAEFGEQTSPCQLKKWWTAVNAQHNMYILIQTAGLAIGHYAKFYKLFCNNTACKCVGCLTFFKVCLLICVLFGNVSCLISSTFRITKFWVTYQAGELWLYVSAAKTTLWRRHCSQHDCTGTLQQYNGSQQNHYALKVPPQFNFLAISKILLSSIHLNMLAHL